MALTGIRSLGSRLTFGPWRAIARLGRRRHSAIFAYHGVDRLPPDQDPEGLCIDPDRFELHVRLLAEAGYEFVTVADFVERSPAPGMVAITFDDGLENLSTVALPILRKYGGVATVYVATGLIGRPHPWLAESSGARIMDAGEIAAMGDAGFEIGAHSVNHRDLSLCSYEESVAEMAGSRETLERVTGGEVTTFAYPYARYSEAAERAARDTGYAAALTYSALARPNDRYALARELVTPKHGAGSIALKVVGRYDSLFNSSSGQLVRHVTRPLRRRPQEPLRPRE